MERTEESLKIELQGNSVFFFFWYFPPNAFLSNAYRLLTTRRWLDIYWPTYFFAYLWTAKKHSKIEPGKNGAILTGFII